MYIGTRHMITDLRFCDVRAADAGLPVMSYTELYPRAGLSAWSEMETWTSGPRSSIVECGPRGSDQNVDWAGVTIYNVICIQTSSGEEWRGNKQGNLYQ